MHRILSAAAGLLIAALPARAGQEQPAPRTDVRRGTDDRRPESPDEHARAEGHWDPKHVEKSERKTAQAQGVVRRTRPSKSEVHRKSETRGDGSQRTEEQRSDAKETARGEVKDESKMVSETKPNPRGGTTTTREVTRSHGEPGGDKDRKSTTKQTTVRDANGNVVSDQKKSE
jgi:hypothetical protein